MGDKNAAIRFDHHGAERVMAAMRRDGPSTGNSKRSERPQP
jgi:hypothetical protein